MGRFNRAQRNKESRDKTDQFADRRDCVSADHETSITQDRLQQWNVHSFWRQLPERAGSVAILLDRFSEIGRRSWNCTHGGPVLPFEATSGRAQQLSPFGGLTVRECGSNMQEFGVPGTAISCAAAKREFLP